MLVWVGQLSSMIDYSSAGWLVLLIGLTVLVGQPRWMVDYSSAGWPVLMVLTVASLCSFPLVKMMRLLLC